MPGLKTPSWGLLIALIIFLGAGSLAIRDVTYPQNRTGDGPPATAVVMVVIDSLSIGDINHEIMPSLTRLTETGSIGLMNGRTAKSQQPEHAYVTIGAGTRAQGLPEAGSAFNSLEHLEGAKAFEVYMRNTNEPAPSAESVVNPYISAIISVNRDVTYEIVPGALGEALRGAGKRTAVFGNSDALDKPCRYAASIAMDRHGFVDMGDVGRSVTLEKPDFPGGIVSDISRLSQGVKDAIGSADFIVVESGDTARMERLWLSGTITADAYSLARREALAAADALIAAILESVSLTDSVLMVVVPTPSQEATGEGHLLTPVVVAGKGFSKGISTSQATRRRGLVTNTDIAATVLSNLGVAVPPWILGSNMASVPDPRPIQSVTELLHRTALVFRIRTPHLKTYVSLLIIVGLGLPVLIVMRTGMEAGGKTATDGKAALAGSGPTRVINSVLLALAAVPLVWLTMPLLTFAGQCATANPSFAQSHICAFLFFEPNSVAQFASSIVCGLSGVFLSKAVTATSDARTTAVISLIPPGALTIILASAIASVVKTGFRTLEGRFAAMCLITGAGIIVDALAGAGLMKYSVLGYDAIGGARFYGIGNEYMGVLIGSLIVGCGLLLDYVSIRAQSRAGQRRLACLIVFIFVLGLLVLASPKIGANLGGTCAAIAGFGVAYALFHRKSFTWVQAAGAAGLGILLIIVIASMDAARSGGPLSHWGKTFLWVRESGIQVLVDAVRRKASMNLRLIRYTIWTKAFLVFIGALAFIGIRPQGLARKILTQRPGFASALSACLVAGGVSLIANDSGIVSAALITMYPALVLLGFAWQETV